MHTLGERVRIIWLNGHTVSEVWDKNEWIFVDTTSNTFAFDKDNEKLTSFLNVYLIWNEGIAFGLLSFESLTIYNIITFLIISFEIHD